MNKLVMEYLNACQKSPSSSRQASCDSNDSFRSQTSSTLKYKTELCRTFEEKGSCPYGSKCRFAHGKAQLVKVEADLSKKKRCNGFWINGCCSYGRRCKFGHEELGWENTACLMACEAQCLSQSSINSKLMKLLQ